MTIFERTKEIANKRGMSIQEVATKAGMGVNSIYGWKKKDPTIGKLKSVAKVLGVSIDYLLGESENSGSADLADDETIFTYEGKPLDDEDKEIIRRLLRGK